MKNTVKILHHVNTFLPTYGGKTNRIYNLTHHDGNIHLFQVPKYKKSNIDISSIVPYESIDNYTISRHSIEHLASINLPLVDYFTNYVMTIVNAYRISRWSIPDRIDQISILYGHSPIEFGLASLLMAKRYNLPCLYEVHGLDYYKSIVQRATLKTNVQFYLKYIQTLIEKYVLKGANAVIAQTNNIKKKIVQIYGINPNKIHVVYNGVDNMIFNPEPYIQQAKELRYKKNWDGKIVCMYSGFLDDINGIGFLIRAISNLPHDLNEKVHFIFMGRGHYAGELELLATSKPNVDFLGLIDYDQMPLMMACADIFTIPRPSTFPSETLVPLKLIEAMAMGKIMLVSDVGGMTEIIQNDESGIVFTNGDEVDYIRKLIDIVKNFDHFSKLGITAKEQAQSNYSWKSSRTTLSKLYSNYVYL